MQLRGINYDTGTHYTGASGPGSADNYDLEQRLPCDVVTIADELRCNGVQFYGDDVDRLAWAAQLGIERGLTVWVQPRLVNAAPDRQIEHIGETARAIEMLARRDGQLVVSVGVELSLFMHGLVPGATVPDRMAAVFSPGGVPDLARGLGEHLARAEHAVRSVFNGPVTYAAGQWEPVPWADRFDLVGIDLYLRPVDEVAIGSYLEPLTRVGKPVVVTEYGCVTHKRALDEYGADVVDWEAVPPRLHAGIRRDEITQAIGVARQFAAIDAAGVHGAFCFTFLEPAYTWTDANTDLDAASFGITRLDRAPHGHRAAWRPKRAFAALADLHTDQARRSHHT